MSSLGIKLTGYYDDVVKKRTDYENIWLRDIRQYKGIYDPEVLAKIDIKRSRAFIRETRTKVRTLDSRAMDLLFPANGDKNWEIVNTPIPSLPAEIEQKLFASIAQLVMQTGEKRDPTPQEIELGKKAYLNETIKGMSTEIEDQLAEIKYRSIIRNVLHSGHLYGTGWLKGPLVNQVVEKHWERDVVAWRLATKPVNRPYAEFKSIWSCYPDMSVVDIDDARFMCERHVMPRHRLVELAKRPDFDGEKILDFITKHPDGTAKYQTYESTLFQLGDNDGDGGETKPLASLKGAYELIEYWGYVSADDLFSENSTKFIEMGSEILNLAEIPVNAWVLDNEVIKIDIEPVTGIIIPYYPYYFDKDETSIFGEGLATVMRDPQRLSNASTRAMIDNASHCAGPQYEVNVDLLAPEEDPTDAGAFKVWLRTGKEADVAGKEVVRIKTITSYSHEFMAMRELFSRLGDEVTIVPRYMQGDSRVSGAARTSSGLSMLMGQANIGLSDLVKFFDDGITKPFITAMFNWNMQFNPRDDIKGDMKIMARGSTALMAKEVRAQQIAAFLQMTLNPTDGLWVKRGNLLRKWADSTDIGADDMVRTQEEYDEELQKQQAFLEKQAASGQGQGGQGGPGYNQLESIIQQQGDGIQQLAEKFSGLEQLVQKMPEILAQMFKSKLQTPPQAQV